MSREYHILPRILFVLNISDAERWNSCGYLAFWESFERANLKEPFLIWFYKSKLTCTKIMFISLYLSIFMMMKFLIFLCTAWKSDSDRLNRYSTMALLGPCEFSRSNFCQKIRSRVKRGAEQNVHERGTQSCS